MGCKMRIETYLCGFKAKNADNTITHDDVFKVMRKLEGKWCRPFTENRVGTMLFSIQNNMVFCRSIMKPKNITCIPIIISVEENTCVKARVRLHTNDNNNEEHVKGILAEYGCSASNITYKKLPFGTISLRSKDELMDIPCADFELDIKINDLEGFKKAYIQGIGDYKDCGCGMITIDNKDIV